MYTFVKSVLRISFTLLKISFWICLVLLILPISVENEEISYEYYEKPALSADLTLEAAQEIYGELSGFCRRVPAVCETGSAAVNLIWKRAVATINIILEYFGGSEVPDEYVPPDY